MFYYVLLLFTEFIFLFSAYNIYIFIFVWSILMYAFSHIFSVSYVSMHSFDVTNMIIFISIILCMYITNLAKYLLLFIPVYIIFIRMYEFLCISVLYILNIYIFNIMDSINLYHITYTND